MELILRDVQDVLVVSEAVFNFDFNEALIHQVVIAYIGRSHQGTKSQKTRSKVTGSNKKPWRQKGTGRARSGSVKSPIWRSGGVTFTANPQSYNQKINKKMYRGALKSILSELIRQDRLIIFEKFSIEAPKTKLLIKKLNDMSLKNVLIVTSEPERNLLLAARNLYKVNVRYATSIDPISLIACNNSIMTANAIKKIEEMLL